MFNVQRDSTPICETVTVRAPDLKPEVSCSIQTGVVSRETQGQLFGHACKQTTSNLPPAVGIFNPFMFGWHICFFQPKWHARELARCN